MLQHGVFAQADATFGPARIFAGARHSFAGQGQTFFSPSGGFVLGRGTWRARGSVYRSFRAPTLNELFREFRVGNAVTQANPQLRPETLFGAEIGLDYVRESGSVRVSAYRNSLDSLITNVTLSTSPTQIIRQRQNAAAALSRGFELNADHRWGNWRGDLGYLYVDSRFATGARVPQIPKHQGTAQITYQNRGTIGTIGLRTFGVQFEDEINQACPFAPGVGCFRLPGFVTLQLMVRQHLTRTLSASLAFENLLDREYLTGFNPTPTVGMPRLWRAGLRWQRH
jgi:outer membrane receptor protein involved in Fe transport